MKYVYRNGELVPKDPTSPSGYVGQARGPYVIRDEMDAVEQVDGKFYTSKAKFRQVGRELGLIEVGDQKFPPRQRPSTSRAAEEKRIQAIKKARAQWASR